MDAVDEVAVTVEQLDGAHAVPAVPQALVPFRPVRGFVVHQEHVFFLAGHIRNHPAGAAPLFHMPDNLRRGFLAVELRMDPRPRLGKVEFVRRPFVPEGGQKFAGECQRADLGPAATDVEDAVFQLLSCQLAGEIVGGEPDPGGGEIPSPVLVCIAVAVFGPDQEAAAVPGDLALVFRLHPFGVPEHLESLGVAEDLVSSESHVEGSDLADPEVPVHLSVGAHPLGMLHGALYTDMAMGTVLGQEAVVGLHAERHAPVHPDALPAPETVQLGRIFAPGPGLHHQIGRFLRLAGNLAEDRLLSAQGRIAEEKLDEERLGRTCLGVITGERMPPPVISLMGLRAV